MVGGWWWVSGVREGKGVDGWVMVDYIHTCLGISEEEAQPTQELTRARPPPAPPSAAGSAVLVLVVWVCEQNAMYNSKRPSPPPFGSASRPSLLLC